METEKQQMYDQIIAAVINNVSTEAIRNGEIILRNFRPYNPTHKLYFMASMIYSDMTGKPIYISMPFFAYLKFKWTNRKRKQLKYISKTKVLEMETDLGEDKVISYVDTIMNFVAGWADEKFGIDRDEFEDIYEEVYEYENSNH